MSDLQHLFDKNQEWADQIKAGDPGFFEKLANQQKPELLWIGCSDSRVPANQIVGLLPGELFVHRNIANTVVHTDFNCLSVLHYAVEVLRVKHVIVCGHYGCGGVQAALGHKQFGLVDYWLRNIRDVYYHQQDAFKDITDEAERVDLLCELNVRQQVANVAHTDIVQNAWAQDRQLAIHGWIYDIRDGLLKEVAPTVDKFEMIEEAYRTCTKTIRLP